MSLVMFTHAGAFGQGLRDYYEQGVKRYNISDFRGALEAWQRGLALAKKMDDKQAIGAFLNNLGNVYADFLADYPQAREEFSRSLKKDEAKEMPTAEFLLADYIGLGLSYEGLKDYPKARDYFQKGIDLIEKQRGALGGAERERFLEAKVMNFPRLEPYHGMIRALIHERGKDSPSRSLFYAERGRSRTFLRCCPAVP